MAQVLSIPLLSKDVPRNCSGSSCNPWLDRLMQIFALFMLCGLFCTSTHPRDQGHHPGGAGRGGTDELQRREEREHRGHGEPAAGGGGIPSPAAGLLGFSYPRLGNLWTGPDLNRSPRMGIMTSPELAAQQQEMSASGRAAAVAEVLGRIRRSARRSEVQATRATTTPSACPRASRKPRSRRPRRLCFRAGEPAGAA